MTQTKRRSFSLYHLAKKRTPAASPFDRLIFKSINFSPKFPQRRCCLPGSCSRAIERNNGTPALAAARRRQQRTGKKTGSILSAGSVREMRKYRKRSRSERERESTACAKRTSARGPRDIKLQYKADDEVTEQRLPIRNTASFFSRAAQFDAGRCGRGSRGCDRERFLRLGYIYSCARTCARYTPTRSASGESQVHAGYMHVAPGCVRDREHTAGNFSCK